METRAILLTAAAFLLWALIHSLTAAQQVKAWVRERIGHRAYDGFYRLAYNLFSVLSILPLLYLLATRAPATILWRIRSPFSWLFAGVQLVGLIGLGASLWQTDVWRFAGIKQALRYLQGAEDPEPPGAFVQSGTYGLVRHPLYFFSMLFIWFTPVMRFSIFLFNVLATLYFLVGAMHEERRLLAEFGEAYRRYRDKVPGFLPWPRRRWGGVLDKD